MNEWRMKLVDFIFYYLSMVATTAFFLISSSSSPGVFGLNSDGETLLSLARHWISPIPPSWNASDADPCFWAGVHCNNHLVVSLHLSASNITGQIGPEISQLTQLSSLNLSSNSISGTIPSQIGNCSLLQQLDLSFNILTGKIPETLGNLLNLKSLSLSNNSLNASLPESIFQIPYLEILLLSFNHLSGFIPSNLGNATRLQKLCIDNNQFTGSLPPHTTLNNLVYLDANTAGLQGGTIPALGCNKLMYLDLSFNHFVGGLPLDLGVNCSSSLEQFAVVDCGLTGPIPSSFGQLKRLSVLHLSVNSLSGNIPPQLSNCTYLTDLQLDQNQFEGRIPGELGRLNELISLFLYSNRLTGEVPMSIWRIQSLEYLLIYDNRLYGELPAAEFVNNSLRLKEFTLYDNLFSGIIPQGLGVNGSLRIIDFYNNSFSGPVPPNLCSGKRLEKLILGYNSFQGSIPSEYGKNCPSLKRLIINDSNLTGVLPDFVNTPNLLYMSLENNRFNGEIPVSFGKLISITEINLSNNNLTGLLPPDLNLLQLQALDLSCNSLEGPLPPQLFSSTPLLLNFNVSHNLFNGSIPFHNMSRLLSTLDLSQNHFSGGGIPPILSEFQALIDLRLGGNPLLGGVIPSSIINLKSLVTLNISNNGLSGPIPLGFSKLVMLQQLDVSHNHLTDTLASLSELHVLTDLNVSYNLFTGPVPPNLLTNSSVYSFLGNPGLCVDCNCTSGILRRCNNSSSNSSRRHSDRGLTKFQTAMVALGTSAFLFAVVVGVGFFFHSRRREKHDIEEKHGYGDKEYYEKEESYLFYKIMEATEDLNEKYIIGRGAHGSVYKASLGPPYGVYAVKKLVFGSSSSSKESMVREIETVGKVRHRNLVKLEDFWMKKDYGLILYRYMHNGSLHDILHEVHPPVVLDWSIRCNIALGTAHGLAYLHFDCDPPIVHRDIKPMNILLDADLEPHISDFGIAKLLDQSSETATLQGTIGYIAPENAFTSTKSKESDVYSYGVVLLELITRKKALDPSFEATDGLDIVKWVRSVWNEYRQTEMIVDTGLLYDSFVSEQVTQLLELALRCTQAEPSRRPSMRDVVKELELVYAAAISSKLK